MELVAVAIITGLFGLVAIMIQRSTAAARVGTSEVVATNGINTRLLGEVFHVINTNETRQIAANGHLEQKIDNLGSDFRGHLKTGHQ